MTPPAEKKHQKPTDMLQMILFVCLLACFMEFG